MVIEIEEGLLEKVKEVFSKLEDDVKIYFFTNTEEDCKYCEDILQILTMLADLSDKIVLIKKDQSSEEAKKYNIPMFPAILLHGKKEYNVRFFGIPAGYEFGALIEDIVDISTGKPQVDPKIAKVLESIKEPVWIKVFVTPTCPYCPIAARTAHKFAMLNKNITSDVIEAMEFAELADKYGVYAVPKVVINDKIEFEGAVPDSFFLAKILEALGKEMPEALIGEQQRHGT